MDIRSVGNTNIINGGGGAANYVAVWSGANTLTGFSTFTYDGTGLVLGTGAVSATTRFSLRVDQASTTTLQVRNSSASASASARLALVSDAGAWDFYATSTAQGANCFIDAPAGFTSGITIVTNTAAASIKLAPNGATALTVGVSSTNRSLFAGQLGIGSDAGTDTAFRVRTNSGLAGTTQYSIYADTIFSSGATSNGIGINSVVNTAAAAYTMGVLYRFLASDPTKGAGSTITRLIQYGGAVPTQGTNNVFLSDNATFTGNYFINNTSTDASLFSGVVNCSAGVRTKYAVTDTATPPTQAELVTAFGTAASNGSGFIGVLNDAGGGAVEYIVFGDGANYFYILGTIGA